MSFLYPFFLFGLFAIFIPVIIHLFNFRSFKLVYFSNVAFLKNIKNETKSKSNLKNLLLLLARILAIAFLVFAFAQPYISKDASSKIEKNQQICIYIDNSFSTEAENKYGKISELAKKKALEIVKAYDAGTQFLYLSNEFDTRHQHLVSKEQIIEFIQETKISPVVRNITEVTKKASDIFSELKSDIFKLYLISDLQRASSNFKEIEADSSVYINLIPIQAENTNNLLIDSLWFESPGRLVKQTDEISVKITNYSSETYNDLPIKLFLNDTLKSTGSFSIKANESIITQLQYSNVNTGIVNGRIEIDDFPVSYDNIFYFSYNLSESIKTLIISNSGENKFITDVFKGNDQVNIRYISESAAYNTNLNNVNVIILNKINNLTDNFSDKLTNFISGGGKVIIFPGVNLNIKQYNKLFNRLNIDLVSGIDTSHIYAGKLNYKSSVLKNVFKKEERNPDLPLIKKKIKFNGQSLTEEETILLSENNDKLISSAKYGKGIVYVFSFAADDDHSNLIYHPLWIPLIYNMVILDYDQDRVYYTLGQDNVIRIKKESTGKESIVHIYNQEKSFDVIPVFSDAEGSNLKVFPGDLIQDAGHYTIVSSDKIKKGISMNYDRKESDLSFYSSSEIQSYIKENKIPNLTLTDAKNDYLSKLIQDRQNGKRLWKLFLIAALFFLLAEIIISKIRFIK